MTMNSEREITTQYIEKFIQTILKGNPVQFVMENNLLAVDHPSEGYLVLQIADKVVDPTAGEDITHASD